jgi:tRNA/tmRNA/rRNA uracil-C5-methylase (TrmA/RlmC/RlmD family)
VIFSGRGPTEDTEHTEESASNFLLSVRSVCSVCSVGRKKKFNDHPFPYRTEIELEISTLTNLGVGLGRISIESRQRGGAHAAADAPDSGSENRESKIENSGGWVVMVPFTLPGERVRARVYRNHKNFSEADLLEVLTPSPHRIAAPCPLFGRCGGCQYQHLTYPEQLAWKRRQVEELLQHLAGIAFPVAPTVPSPRDYGYRSKITPHFAAPRREWRGAPDQRAAGESGEQAEGSLPPIGFLKQGSRFDLVDVPACPIATPEINAKLTEVRAATRAKLGAGAYDRGATLLLRHAQEGVVTDYDAIIHEVIAPAPCHLLGDKSQTSQSEPAGACHLIGDKLPGAPLRLHFLARDFFQNNPFILPAFTGYVRAQAAATGAKFLVDAYCGSGLFALSCAPAFERVAGVEVSATSVQFARENAAANGIGNATFSAGDAATIFAGLGPEFVPADTAVVIDPPRKGCDESFLQQLFAFGPRAVVYVSCDPATQMRDLRHFLAAGYALTAVQPFDLFPQTRHLECVITLRRSA